MGAYSIGAYSMGAYSLQRRIWSLEDHLPARGLTFWGHTVWGVYNLRRRISDPFDHLPVVENHRGPFNVNTA